MKLMLKKKGLSHCLSLTIATLGLGTGDAHAQELRTLKLLEPSKTVTAAINPRVIKPIRAVEAPAFDQRDIRGVETFSLLVETVDSFNAATFVTVERNRRNANIEEFTAVLDGVETVFNDQGRGADIEAGDGVFAAFVRIDANQQLRDELAFLERADKARTQETKVFSGRSLVDVKDFDLQDSFEKILQPRKIISINGFDAIKTPSFIGALTPIPFTGDENKVLGINSPAVVSHPSFTYDPCDTDGTGNNIDPDNDWSFKTLMANLNQGTGLTTQEFIHQWLRNWMTNSSVNGFVIASRTGVMDYFPGWDGVNASTLDIDNLPFRLLAVMNRLDLAKVSYASTSSGETRFVFGLLNPNTCTPAFGINQMTVIFEYGDTAQQCSAIKSRAQEWLALDSLALGSAAYMNALKAITDDVTQAPGAAAALNQLRTNDFAFDGLGMFGPWQLREFVVDSGSGLLVPTTTKQTPDASFRSGNSVMAQYMEQNANAILCESHTVPTSFVGNPFLAASLDYLSTSFWTAPTNTANLPAVLPSCYTSSISNVSGGLPLSMQIQSEVRHKFSVNTCDDCHAQETNTFFTHVNPVTRDFSGFMTGITVADPQLGPPASGGIDREFDDLQRRGQIIEELAVRSCFGGILGSNVLINAAQVKSVH
jgi:hypothetical protein